MPCPRQGEWVVLLDMTKIIQARVGQNERTLLMNHLPRLQGKSILMIGDVGVDEYVMGQVRRISPEAPVPILEVEQEETRLGLGANITQNLLSLGGKAITVGIVGNDAGAGIMKDLFQKIQASWDGMVIDSERPTTRKTRVMSGHHHIVRVDYEHRKYISEKIENDLIQKTKNMMNQCDGVILQDYGKGVVTPTLVQKIVELCKSHQKPLFVDPHRSNPASFYKGVDLIKPNYDEAVAMSGLKFDDLRDNPNKVLEVGREIQRQTGAKKVILTRGKEGMTIFQGEEVTEVPTFARKVFDVTGAGDTVISTLSLGVVSGLDLVHSCMLANFAAGVVVGKIGSVPCGVDELKEYILS